MKRLLPALLLASGLLFSHTATAQFRPDPSKDEPKLNTADAMKEESSFLGGIFDPSKFSMHQSYSMSMSSSSFGSYGISMLTNTFSYKASDNLFIAADLSAVYSPFSSFGDRAISDRFSKSVNGVYLTNARLDWKLGESTFLRVQYSGGPNSMYGYGYPSFFDEFGSPRPATPSAATPGAVPTRTVFGQITH